MRKILVLLLLFVSPCLYSQTIPASLRVIQQAAEKSLSSSAPFVRAGVRAAPKLPAPSVFALPSARRYAQFEKWAASQVRASRPTPALDLASRRFAQPYMAALLARHQAEAARFERMGDEQLVSEWVFASVLFYAWEAEMPFFEWPRIEKTLAEYEFLSRQIRRRHLENNLSAALVLSGLPHRSRQVLPCGRSIFWLEFMDRSLIHMPDGSLKSPRMLLQTPDLEHMLEKWMDQYGYEARDLKSLNRVSREAFAVRFEAWYGAALAQVSALTVLEARTDAVYRHGSFSFRRLAELKQEMPALESLTDEHYARWLNQEPYASRYRSVAGRIMSHYVSAQKELDVRGAENAER